MSPQQLLSWCLKRNVTLQAGSSGRCGEEDNAPWVSMECLPRHWLRSPLIPGLRRTHLPVRSPAIHQTWPHDMFASHLDADFGGFERWFRRVPNTSFRGIERQVGAERRWFVYVSVWRRFGQRREPFLPSALGSCVQESSRSRASIASMSRSILSESACARSDSCHSSVRSSK